MIEVLRQARNAFVWNLNTDLDNIPACDQWAKMLRKNIDDLDKAIAKLEQHTWIGLTDAELAEFSGMELGSYDLCLEVEAKLKDKNNA
jgi:DNA-directed RNA polymerase specialized sigma subunit